jgi:hypothetical protein
MPKKRVQDAKDELPLFPPLTIISAERNLEGWPLWQPADSRAKPKARIVQREMKLEDGKQVVASVEIGYTQLGMLSTEDQKTFYAIVKLWEDTGRPDVLKFSLRQLARTLKKNWGTNERTSLIRSLRRLADTPLTWLNSYHDSSSNRTVRVLKSFRILDRLQIVELDDPSERVTAQSCEARFHEITLGNLRNFYTKPLLFEKVISFESGIALLLYRHLDLVMADKLVYKRRTRDLLEEIGIDGEGYQFASARKRVLERAFRELDGAPLTTGRIASISIEKTKDQKDYNAIFSKEATPGLRDAPELPELAAFGADSLDSSDGTPSQTEALHLLEPDQELALTSEAQALVRYFHRTVHGVEPSRPKRKELQQAEALVRDEGFESARYLVDFALAEARRTNYPIQVFGFVLQYADRARAERSRSDENPSQDLSCPLCHGRGRIVFRHADGTETVTGCPHDPQTVGSWERSRGLTFRGAETGS